MGAGASTAPATGDDKAALPQAALEKAFKAADSDNDGFLTTAELATLLEGHGHAEPERKAKGLALWLSASKPDGVAGKEGVSVAEFVAAVAELNSFVKALVEKKAPAEKKPLPPTPRPEAPAAPTKPVPAAAATPPAAATSALDAGVFEEMNLARTKPAEYAAHLDAWLPHFDGKNYKPPGAATTLVTQEGAAAVTEAIEFLKKQTPLKPFAKVSEGMSRASLDHVLDCGPKGLLGHDGSDKSTPFERLNRHGQWQKTAGENINYGATVARDAVLALIVDDGVASRGHRCNIFSADFTVVGIASGPHKDFGSMTCVTHAGGFLEEGEAPPEPTPAAPAASGGGGGAAPAAPPGGKKAVATSVSISGGKKTTTTTTTITDKDGNTETFVETMVETA